MERAAQNKFRENQEQAVNGVVKTIAKQMQDFEAAGSLYLSKAST